MNLHFLQNETTRAEAMLIARTDLLMIGFYVV
jgi:hypothetical protein